MEVFKYSSKNLDISRWLDTCRTKPDAGAYAAQAVKCKWSTGGTFQYKTMVVVKIAALMPLKITIPLED